MEFYNKVQSQQTEVDQGELKVSVFTEDGTRPIENALVRISYTGGVGNTVEEVEQDKEGLDTMYALGKNMAWMLKCIEAGKKAGIDIPQNMKRNTNFIR